MSGGLMKQTECWRGIDDPCTLWPNCRFHF